MKLLMLSTFLALVSGAAFRFQADFSLPKAGLEGLLSAKDELERTVSSLMESYRSPTNTPVPPNSEEVAIFPRVFFENPFFDELTSSWGKRIKVTLATMNHSVIVPHNSKAMFLFSMESTEGEDSDILELIKSSPPFTFPSPIELIDYYVVVPMSYLDSKIKKSRMLSNTYPPVFLRTTTKNLPFFSTGLTKNMPLLVFQFGSPKTETHNTLSKVVSIKNYFPKAHSSYTISAFFDQLAKAWVENIGQDSLIKSIFCMNYTNSRDRSYCLKIEDHRQFQVYPAFASENENMLNDTVEAQVLRQVHSGLHKVRSEFNDKTYQLAHNPTSIFRKVDQSAHDLIMDARDKSGRSFQKAVERVNLLHTDGGFNDRNEREQPGFPDQKYSSEEAYVTKRHPGEWNDLPFRGLVFPLQSLNFTDDIANPPRTRAYSQIIDNFDQYNVLGREQLVKRYSIFSDDVDCEPITWFNIFHYSIFGKPKFCSNQTKT